MSLYTSMLTSQKDEHTQAHAEATAVLAYHSTVMVLYWWLGRPPQLRALGETGLEYKVSTYCLVHDIKDMFYVQQKSSIAKNNYCILVM